MKVYISVDIEGTAAAASWQATELGDKEHGPAARQMTLEAVAACEGALKAGASELYVKDAHDSGRNMDLSLFPKEARIIYDWSLTPDSMIAGLDSSFDALLFVGYHSPAGLPGNPLCHTMNRDNCWVKINGQLASEFTLHALLAASRGVPSVFLSGDEALCLHARSLVPEITTVAVKDCLGRATISRSSAWSLEQIREMAAQSLSRPSLCLPEVPKELVMEIRFKDYFRALRASYYPGVTRLDDCTVSYRARSMDELMAARMFIL